MVDFDSTRKLIDDDSVDTVGPMSKAIAEKMCDGTVHVLVRGNTIKLLGLDLG